MAKRPTLPDLGMRIHAHLKRFEADPVINAIDPTYKTKRFYQSGAGYYGGRYLTVRYVSYQGGCHLTRDEAEAYLAALDGGFVGTHYSWKHSQKKAQP